VLEPISLDLFRKRTGLLSKGWEDWNSHAPEYVVSLREMVEVLEVKFMSKKYLRALLDSVTLEGDKSIHPYEGCEISFGRIDSSTIQMGQSFVERSKYQRILESLNEKFSEHCMTRGFAKMQPIVILGRRANGELAIAHYIPPVVEHHEVDVLLDGVHRLFLIKGIGTTVEAIILKGVKYPFPCKVHDWSRVVPVDKKPPREERYEELRPELFRSLTWVGIDG